MIDFRSDLGISEFRRSLKTEFHQYLLREGNRFPAEECLRIDFHCHDHNSDVPDELWGRILGLPETWLKTKQLVKCLKKNGCSALTITNHNNARSCWSLLDKGEDVLVGAEFTCHFDEYNLFVHVLTYGFTPEQEVILNKKRQNIYEFLRYTTEHDIPVILPHPLYFYTPNEKIDLTLFEKMALMFQRFEVLNGQRDIWQSVLTLNWTQTLSEEKLSHYANKHQLNPADFGVDISKPKVLTGGSDDHMGIFAGECGSRLWVPDLQQRLKTEKPSQLALEAIRAGHIAPFGQVAENQKLNIALLDYFSQIATKIEDPGLLRILLHRGETRDKVACFAISNLMLELQRHKNSKKFFNFIHDALQGKKPNKLIKWNTPKDYKFCVEYLEKIADSKKQTPEEFVDTVNSSIGEMFTRLNKLIIDRLKSSSLVSENNRLENFSTEELTRSFEIPSQLSALVFGGTQKRDMSDVNIKQVLSNLSSPILIGTILTGVSLTSTRLLYQNRDFLNDFAEHIGSNRHQKRALYLTDTLRDKNGVSNSLTGKLREIQKLDLPVDFLICHEEAEAEPHLHVVRPLSSFSLPQYGEQELRIPDLMEIARIFYEGGYDRVVCSTEGPMAVVSLFLKYMFNVPGFFFMHTDWMDFLKHTTNLNQHERDRVRRLMRLLYKRYDGVFVLNSDHREWLTGHQMELEEERVFLTAHHAREKTVTAPPVKKSTLFADASDDTPVLFIACRLSREKGIFDLPEILSKARESLPDLKLVIAGDGPAEAELKQALPDAKFLGWVTPEQLAACYSGLDLFIFPSRFDTFGNVILEAFVNGMPAISYNCKGPKDIIQHQQSGFLVKDTDAMAAQIVEYFNMPAAARAVMGDRAEIRASEYHPEPIMRQFLTDMGLPYPQLQAVQQSVA